MGWARNKTVAVSASSKGRNADLSPNFSQPAEKQGKIADAVQYEGRFLDEKRAELTSPERQ
jgi:hypothetical protein